MIHASNVFKSPLVVGALRNFINRFGITVRVYPKVLTVYDGEYGVYSGVQKKMNFIDTKVLAPLGAFTTADAKFAASFDSGYIYALVKVEVGDIIALVREDYSKYRYKVVQADAVGFEKETVVKFKISPLGD